MATYESLTQQSSWIESQVRDLTQAYYPADRFECEILTWNESPQTCNPYLLIRMVKRSFSGWPSPDCWPAPVPRRIYIECFFNLRDELTEIYLDSSFHPRPKQVSRSPPQTAGTPAPAVSRVEQLCTEVLHIIDGALMETIPGKSD